MKGLEAEALPTGGLWEPLTQGLEEGNCVSFISPLARRGCPARGEGLRFQEISCRPQMT